MATKEPDVDAVSNDDLDEQSAVASKQPSKEEMNTYFKTLFNFSQYCAEAMPLAFKLQSLYYKQVTA